MAICRSRVRLIGESSGISFVDYGGSRRPSHAIARGHFMVLIFFGKPPIAEKLILFSPLSPVLKSVFRPS